MRSRCRLCLWILLSAANTDFSSAFQGFFFTEPPIPFIGTRLSAVSTTRLCSTKVDAITNSSSSSSIPLIVTDHLDTPDSTASSSLINSKRFLLQKGKSADLIFSSPAVSGLTVCRGWSPKATEALMAATRTLVQNNPILSGYVYKVKRDFVTPSELWIQAGKYPADKHNFVKIIEAPPSLQATTADISTLSSNAFVSYVQEHIAPCFNDGACLLTSVQAKQQLPVLQVTLMVLPPPPPPMDVSGNNATSSSQIAVYSLSMSHAVGDGVTFFQILKQLSLFMSGRVDKYESAAIDWDVTSRATHELFPRSFSQRDVEISYGLPFFVGLIKNAIATLMKRKPTFLLIDKAAVKSKVREMRIALNCTTLSSNDVISTALCQADDALDVIIFTENARDDVNIPRNAGGNFFYEIPISAQAVVENPLNFRNAVLQKAFYRTNQLPAQPFWCGRVGRITSLATITEQVIYDGIETICSMPLSAFLQNIPMDVALIFRYDKKLLGVLHNFIEIKKGGLLDAILFKD